MLTNNELELITSYVDGELSASQQRDFESLMARSVTANELYNALLADRHALSLLPPRPAPHALTQSILNCLSKQSTPKAIVRQPVSMVKRWIPIGLAASFLIAVSSATYWYVASGDLNSRMARNRQVQQLPHDDKNLVPSTSSPITTKEPVTDDWLAIDRPGAKPIVGPEPEVIATDVKPANPMVIQPEPKPNPERILTAPATSDVKAFDRVELQLPLLIPFTDLNLADTTKLISERVGFQAVTRIDFFASDTVSAADQLIEAAKKVNLTIRIDTVANERLKRKMTTAWCVYSEALTPDEIAKWMAALRDAKFETQYPAMLKSKLHVLNAGASDFKDAQSLIGVDLGKRKAASAGQLSDQTISQLTEALQKTDPSRQGIMFTYLPQAVRVHPLLSREIRQFNELRGQPKVGTSPVMIVIRPIQ